MDDLKFTARKMYGAIEISQELLDDWAPGAATSEPPVRRPPSSTCDYEHSDDYYSEGHTCELPVGHEGPHRCSLEWDTRAYDVCKAEGHIWAEWEPWPPQQQRLSGWEWKTPPTNYRCCSRECGAREYQGGERNAAFSNAILGALLS